MLLALGIDSKVLALNGLAKAAEKEAVTLPMSLMNRIRTAGSIGMGTILFSSLS